MKRLISEREGVADERALKCYIYFIETLCILCETFAGFAVCFFPLAGKRLRFI